MIFLSDAPPVESRPPIPMYSNASAGLAQATDKPKNEREITLWPYPLRSISTDGGKTILRLIENPVVEVDHDSQVCKVLHWDVQLPLTNVAEISRVLARRFLELYSKAIDGRLSEQEEAQWLEVVRRVDYQAFCNDRAPARYVEGVIKSVGPKRAVEWYDGEVEELHSQVARTLNVLNVGDRFGAWVKWGRDNKTQQIEGLKIL